MIESIKIYINNSVFNDVKFNLLNENKENIQNMVTNEVISAELTPLAKDINNFENLLYFAKERKCEVIFFRNNLETIYKINSFTKLDNTTFIICAENL